MTIGAVSFFLRKKMKVDGKEGCYCFVNGKYGLGYELEMFEVYKKYKQNDGCLHITFLIGIEEF